MKLKESLQMQEGIGEENILVSSPPVFDLERARRVNDIAGEWLAREGFDNFSSLVVACRLSLYNFSGAESLDPNALEIFFNRFRLLGNKEKVFSDPKNPFPTIGVEIEAPRLRIKVSDLPSYASFFDRIGMPRNQINKGSLGGGKFGVFWEFSPHPSSWAGTPSRIISELIKGGFIPSLLGSQKPEDIRHYLDNKLVSLHVNLGIPMDTSAVRGRNDNFEAFSNMVSLAFTSPLRLAHRASLRHFDIKRGEETSKSKLSGQLFVDRLELKALEVRTESTYRLLRESQLLAGALFAFLSSGDPWLSQKWQEFRKQAESLTRKTFWGQSSPLSSWKDKDFIVRELENTQIQQQLRSLIAGITIEIAKKYGV